MALTIFIVAILFIFFYYIYILRDKKYFDILKMKNILKSENLSLKEDEDLIKYNLRKSEIENELDLKLNRARENRIQLNNHSMECYIDSTIGQGYGPNPITINTRLLKENPVRKKISDIFPNSKLELPIYEIDNQYKHSMLEFQINRNRVFSIDIYNNKSNLN